MNVIIYSLYICSRAFSCNHSFKQATLLLSQIPRMVEMNIRMTATFESLLQLSLQFFIIFLKSDGLPSTFQVNAKKIKLQFFSQIFTILTSLFMVSVGASEDFLTSMMNKQKELEMGEKNRNPSVKYYSKLSFLERGQKLGENPSFPI